MLVSVIMSVFNGEKFLNKTISSILNQTYKNLEFIIIDDGSKDNSLSIVRDFAKRDNRVKLIKNSSNIGLTKSLNKAIDISKGKYIARQDVDDYSLSNRLEIQIKFLENNPEYAFCGSDMYVLQERSAGIDSFDYERIIRELIIRNKFMHSTIIIKKQILELFGYYNEQFLYSQDYELWCRLLYKYSVKAKNLKKKLVVRNIQPEKLSKNRAKKFVIQQLNSIRVRLKYVKYVENGYSIFRTFVEIVFRFSTILYFILIFLTKCSMLDYVGAHRQKSLR